MSSRIAALLLLACACAVEAHPRPPPRLLPPPEAVAIAAQYARSHGLVVDTTYRARLDRRARWHVLLGGAGGRDRAAVTVDGYSGRVIAARLSGARGELAPPPPPPGTAPGAIPEPEPEAEPAPATPPGPPPAAPPPPPPPG
ncbi:hypothetical protein [Anaeromyxobacter diazotrophicus]|uniref:PepSY domain-containing protein n=1 Tax=Anaeromyxobacter diazotrophicus TaxID=2590199 RepID=A0A7I9VP76_9BACT|nr:hypothetical protein [Anaeromyxobacter diazotrophicus]GEJ57757.1 hypothetical protein AMYX_24980 [Anaeromyxobacter diazotrophicus]